MDVLDGDIVPVGADATITVDVLDAGPLQLPWCMVTLYVPACVALNVASVCPLINVPFLNHA